MLNIAVFAPMPERQRQQRDRRESGIATQRAQRIADVADPFIQQRHAARIPHLLAHALDSRRTTAPPDAAPRRAHAARSILQHLHLE
jgi:hypothetical protein